MSTLRRAPIALTALALTACLTPAAGAAPAELSSELSSRAGVPSQVVLPKQAYELADEYNVALPDFVKQPVKKGTGDSAGAQAGAANAATAESVRKATAKHLQDMGHTPSTSAYTVAQEWAAQAAAGQATFTGKVGQGITHRKEGTGNINRLTNKEAQDRLKWLDRDANTAKDKKRFGTAVAVKGNYIYLVEYFYNS